MKKWGRTPFFSFSFALAALFGALAWGAEPLPGALDTARRLHEHLAAGNIAEAAALSNTPRRRYEVLRDYQAAVGEEEFKRVYQAYLHPENRVVAEVVLGPHRLLIWRLVGLERLAGEYFVEVDGRVLLDDVPSEARAQLRRVLLSYREKDRQNRGQRPISPSASVPAPSFGQ